MAQLGITGGGEFEDALRRHVLDPWFPRCIDRDYGGFLCDFDRMWRPCGTHDKLLEFQARQTLTAAEALRFYPDDQRLRLAAVHGVRCLREVMWDREAGGWYHLTDRAGQPLEAQTKHTHGFAYAIQACAAVHAVTGDPEALVHAKEGFAWMDRLARDEVHGGYFGFLSRDGVPIMDAAQCPWPAERDTVNTEFGLKDLNVHSDLVETFVYLYRVWPDATVGARLHEILDIVTKRMVVPSTGAMHFFVTPDWHPIPHLIRAGYQCHNAFRILMAIGLAGDADHLRRSARLMVDHALRYLVDHDTGGFYYASPGAGPETLRGHDIRVKSKDWWVQMEALKALRAIARLIPEEEKYARAFQVQWRYVQRYLLDEEFGGVYSAGLDQDSRWRRQLGPSFAPDSTTRKGDRWKDASHDARALLYCAETERSVSR
ncbi:MAG TPA: AGE family epimerase/isomerase [Gemmatimonadales bacterium]|nr:AGE family epimerase/isomerase [Gemmatimonadales bacterium]